MDFARKQLEKYGWKNGDGLGRTNQGIAVALKPSLKSGKEGMGFELGQELTDTWWTRAYTDSLSRINVDKVGEELAVSLKQDEEDGDSNPMSKNVKTLLGSSEGMRPIEKMRRRMMKSNFTSFSKGGTLSNGEMMDEETDSESSNHSESFTPAVTKVLTDEELLKACGGRTAHKAARFGHKLNGKLARIAAQEAAMSSIYTQVTQKRIEESSEKKPKKSKKRKHEDGEIEPCDNVLELELKENENSTTEEIPKKKKKSKQRIDKLNVEDSSTTIVELSLVNENSLMEDVKSKKKKKSKKKRSKGETKEIDDTDNSTIVVELSVVNEESPTEEVKRKKKKKSKDKCRKNEITTEC